MTNHTTEAIEQNDQAPAKKNKALFWVLGSFLVILLIAGGIVWAALAKLGGFERIEDAFPDESFVLLRLNLLKDKTNLRSTFCCSAQILVPILPLQFWMILATARTASWWR